MKKRLETHQNDGFGVKSSVRIKLLCSDVKHHRRECLRRRNWQEKGTKMSRKLVKFLIMFDNSNLLFFPGQFLTGRVILEVDEDMPVLGKTTFFS